ncbi:UNVERIFIED_CONTAM: hypothetical protein HDU68_009343 [Siphonaria sp. JEL0065]|nr:hypothetical protein HDU68_009343 [Siphonaria sp. JEL0065]
MTTWQPPSDGKWMFALIGPQGKVGAGEQWYLRLNHSINGIPNLNPTAAQIKAINSPAVSGNPNTAGTGINGGAGSGFVPGTGNGAGIVNPGPAPPSWQKPVMVGGTIAGIIAVFAIGSLIYTKFKKPDDELPKAVELRETPNPSTAARDQINPNPPKGSSYNDQQAERVRFQSPSAGIPLYQEPNGYGTYNNQYSNQQSTLPSQLSSGPMYGSPQPALQKFGYSQLPPQVRGPPRASDQYQQPVSVPLNSRGSPSPVTGQSATSENRPQLGNSGYY